MGDYNSGSDAAYIKPKFVPEDGLHGPDLGGGPDMKQRHAEFGDGGMITDPKGYLSTGKSK